jgi:hypothetical protein
MGVRKGGINLYASARDGVASCSQCHESEQCERKGSARVHESNPQWPHAFQRKLTVRA